MLATVSNLPKWLLAAVMFCVLLGHLEQVKDKTRGCCSAAVEDSSKTPAKEKPLPTSGVDHCTCQCHFSTEASVEIPAAIGFLRFVQEVERADRHDRAPEVPCAEIEYPPRSVRA